MTNFFQSHCLVCSSIFPGIAFSLDLIETTQQYGVAEILLSSFMAAAVFSIFGAQPLCIAGVTGTHICPHLNAFFNIISGPITVLNKTIFDVVANRPGGPNYLQFVGWVYLWGAILHWVTAALNCAVEHPLTFAVRTDMKFRVQLTQTCDIIFL